MKIGFTCGAFDLFHAGHVLMLGGAKKHCDYLIVGVQVDPSVDRPKDKKKPIQTIVERQIQLNACVYVDEIIVYETEEDLEDILSSFDIDIRFVGSDHKNGFMTGESICDKRNIKIYYNEREHGFSTTNLRNRIKE